MDTASQIFKTIDTLKIGASDLFYSLKIVTEEPDQSYSAWHLHEVIPSDRSQFPQITRLYLQDCNHLQSLTWLEDFPNLEMLWIYGSDKLADVEGIQGANKLKSLTIWPSFVANITLDSLAPIADLNELEELIFSGKTRDDSLDHLGNLQHLRIAFFSNSYSWEKIARFEASHPKVNFPWKGGVVYSANPTVLKCKKCELPQAMLSGKGLRLSCPTCDSAYIKKHVERYQRIAIA